MGDTSCCSGCAQWVWVRPFICFAMLFASRLHQWLEANRKSDLEVCMVDESVFRGKLSRMQKVK